jgi:hypothetical protein
MMSTVHIYRAAPQPATDFVDNCTGNEMRFTYQPRKRLFVRCCRRLRWAQYLVVQVYYADVLVSCSPGHGCKKEQK